jgi:two-component system sensor histidine kinase BaeS
MHADPERLSQIVINLLTNALKATAPGGAVRIKAYKAGTNAALAVSDTGKGIRQQDLPFVFERFYKGEEGGLGLGLAIVKELVEAHGGAIEVKSDYGKGAVFTVSIPSSDLHNSS